jgi:formamidase
MVRQEAQPSAPERVIVDRYTDVVGPGNEMLGPVSDGGRIEFRTVPGCWGPMMTPSVRSGHEVTLPVRVAGADLGDSIAVQVEQLKQISRATTSGTEEEWDGRGLSDGSVAAICPACRDAGRHFRYPDTYLEGTGQSALRCSQCHSQIMPFRIRQGYTMVFDLDEGMAVTVTSQRAQQLAADARDWAGLPAVARQHPAVALASADLAGVTARCQISMGNLGCIPAIDMPSSHNCGDLGVYLVGAKHEFAMASFADLQARTDAHMDVKSVRAGSVLIVPVKVAGGGLYAGDAHAMIGAGEVAGHAADISARLVVRVHVIKGLALDGPVLLPRPEDLPFLARPFTQPEQQAAARLARAHGTRLEGPVLPVQVLGSGRDLNDAVDNAVGRAAALLAISPDEVRNRATVCGGVEIGRLPGFVQVSLLAPAGKLERAGLLRLAEQSYRDPVAGSGAGGQPPGGRAG